MINISANLEAYWLQYTLNNHLSSPRATVDPSLTFKCQKLYVTGLMKLKKC